MSDNKPGGYAGSVLRVDLSRRQTAIEPLDTTTCRQYLGGAGFVIHHLWKELPPKADALGPENRLVFAAGPLTGGVLPGGGRHCVGAKSPLTGSLAKSEVGETWGAELKRAGFDMVVVEGKSDTPVYLAISKDGAVFRDARHLWGKETAETQKAIREELGDDRVRVAMIGLAGEKMVRFACIMHGLHDAAGRGGLGAVMGTKNLKAIAVRGSRTPSVVNPGPARELAKWLAANMNLMRRFHEFGTGANMEAFEVSGNLPVLNFRDGLFPNVKKIDAKTLKETMGTGMDACYGCPVRCKKVIALPGPHPTDPGYGGPEYETLAALGSNCGINDLNALARANALCGAFSLDTISTGMVISFAMECYEKGILNSGDSGGLALRFGNAEAMLRLIELIARREGVGDLLAEGTARAAERLGRGAPELAMHVKGLEMAMHDPRLKPGMGVGYMVNPHGADHSCNMQDTAYLTKSDIEDLLPLGIAEALPANDIGPGKVALLKAVQMKHLLFDSLVLCQFFPYGYHQLAPVISGVTGWDIDVFEMEKIAERVMTTARLFIHREGFTAADDRLPARFFQPKRNGVLADKPLDPVKMEKARACYYEMMGWDSITGVPREEKVREIGI